MNGVLCYFPCYAILQGNVQMFGRIGVEDFLSMIFKNFYIGIWSCMKFEDVL